MPRLCVAQPRCDTAPLRDHLIQPSLGRRALVQGLRQLRLTLLECCLQPLSRLGGRLGVAQFDHELLMPFHGIAQLSIKPAPLRPTLIHARQRRRPLGSRLCQLSLAVLKRRL